MQQQRADRAVMFMSMPFHGKTLEERRQVLAVSEVANDVCRRLNVELRRPWLDPAHTPARGQQEQYLRDRRLLTGADCLLALAWNSAGSGAQVEIAVNLLMPVIYLVPAGSSVSPNTIGSLARCLGIISFSEPEDIRSELSRILSGVEPGLFARRHARSRGLSGERIRQRIVRLRNNRGWSREELARKMDYTVEFVTALETEPDEVMNATAAQIYALAFALDVPAGWILDPNEEMSLRALEGREIVKLCLEEKVTIGQTLGFIDAMRPNLAEGGTRVPREELRALLRFYVQEFADL